MKNEYAKIRATQALTVILVLLNSFYLLQALGDDDMDPSIFFAIFIARLTLIFAVALFLNGRLLRRVSLLFPAPCNEMQLLLARLGAVICEFGYHALDTAVADHWAFEAKPINLEGNVFNRPAGARTVSIEVAGPGLLRVVGSSALLREIRKQFPGTVRIPYAGPQPWIARGKTVLALSAAVVLVFGACISYVAPVIRARRHQPPAVVTERAGQHPASSPER